VSLALVAEEWLESRRALKRKTQESDLFAWRVHIAPRFGKLPVASITSAEVAHWAGGLATKGLAPSTVCRYLASLRSVLDYAVADGRVSVNVAASVKAPTSAKTRREGLFLTVQELDHLADECRGTYGQLVKILGLAGLRWGEMAGLRVGDLVRVPGRGLRLQRAVLASSTDGSLYVDTLKGHRAPDCALGGGACPGGRCLGRR
jgi:integrase